MTSTNTIARTLHDGGLAAWFGGSLMGAVGLNGAASQATDSHDRLRVATIGWNRWAPVSAAAVAAHLAGGALVVSGNKGRIAGQSGVGAWTASKTALTGVALAASALSVFYNRKLAGVEDSPAAGATEPGSSTPASAAGPQKKLRFLQWVIPATTGGLLVTTARMSEQQRPTEVASGLLDRITPD